LNPGQFLETQVPDSDVPVGLPTLGANAEEGVHTAPLAHVVPELALVDLALCHHFQAHWTLKDGPHLFPSLVQRFLF